MRGIRQVSPIFLQFLFFFLPRQRICQHRDVAEVATLRAHRVLVEKMQPC